MSNWYRRRKVEDMLSGFIGDREPSAKATYGSGRVHHANAAPAYSPVGEAVSLDEKGKERVTVGLDLLDIDGNGLDVRSLLGWNQRPGRFGARAESPLQKDPLGNEVRVYYVWEEIVRLVVTRVEGSLDEAFALFRSCSFTEWVSRPRGILTLSNDQRGFSLVVQTQKDKSNGDRQGRSWTTRHHTTKGYVQSQGFGSPWEYLSAIEQKMATSAFEEFSGIDLQRNMGKED
ncbi:hypothetical protein BDN72DRAFT_862079 [Pluteus cervinus]|uniref:Uncharacterized protein n=1 Tax=Pluteus cervinus TaxID=181527 RepID=A0ACD3AD04_9AGAR|nr:hypothetical protein BDN72DRAFT_862079 [Pluteus cervinus]